MKETNNRYLFLSDLDGTLLNDKKEVTPKTKEALRKYTSMGNVFAICTGRDIYSAKSVYKGLGLELPNSFIVGYNGGLIYDVDAGKTIFRTGIRLELVKEIFEIAESFGIYVQTYNDDFILTKTFNECTAFYKKVICTPLIVADDIMPYLTEKPCKIMCIELSDHEKQERFRKYISEKYSDELYLVYSSEYYLELIPKGSGKDTAIERISSYLGIAHEHTIAAGDADNDTAMISSAGIGIAMKNGIDKAKKAADIVTKTDNNHDGLAEVLLGIING